MKKIGIITLGTRRPSLWEVHAEELSKCKYTDYHMYLLVDDISMEYANKIKNILQDKITIVVGFSKDQNNYINKIIFGINQSHLFSIKHDEDAVMTSASWDRFFELTETMTNEDVFCTGSISNGIPTTELFIEHHIPEAKEKIYKIFNSITLGPHGGADHSSLHANNPTWDSNDFYKKLTNFYHYYKGIHPVRESFESVKMINDEIMKNFHSVMSPKEIKIIKDSTKYPYLCSNIFGIKTIDWKTIVEDRSLYVDNFDEVPINRFRNNTKRNLVIDVGIPILHTMYNWTPEWEYENILIENIKLKLKEYS